MVNILLSLILTCFVVFLALTFYILLKIRRKYTDIVDFITPTHDNEASALAKTFEAISEMVGRAIVASIKAWLIGQKSIEVRQGHAEAGEALSMSPLGGLVNILPNSLKKSLIKNPQLIDMAMGYINRNNGGGGGGGSTASPAKFKL